MWGGGSSQTLFLAMPLPHTPLQEKEKEKAGRAPGIAAPEAHLLYLPPSFYHLLPLAFLPALNLGSSGGGLIHLHLHTLCASMAACACTRLYAAGLEKGNLAGRGLSSGASAHTFPKQHYYSLCLPACRARIFKSRGRSLQRLPLPLSPLFYDMSPVTFLF